MVKIVRLESGPLGDGFIPSLKGQTICLSQAHPYFERLLQDDGISYTLLVGDSLPDEVTLVLVPSPFDELVQVVDRLLGPGGCPWDQAQTHDSLKKYLLEEAYEVIDAIDSGDQDAMCEELGDLLLQPVMHGQISKVANGFETNDAVRAIVEKLIRRHPHVFGDIHVADADEVLRNWDQIKQTEKSDVPQSIIAGVPKGMASLLRAHEVSKRVARVGFEWPDIAAVFDKLREEEQELKDALGKGNPKDIESELGDLLFTVVNIARWAKVEPEEALRTMVNRFSKRFMQMESIADKNLKSLTSEEWNELWIRAKAEVG